MLELLQAGAHDEEVKKLLEQLISEEKNELELPEPASHRILQSIIGEEEKESVPLAMPGRRSTIFNWKAVAATVAVMITVTTLFLLQDNSAAETPPMAVAQQDNDGWQMVKTAAGERKNLRLADGTEIWLSPSSSLKYPQTFEAGIREVHLSGEAFFEVASNPTQPFVIHSGNIDTKVLGTSFNIQAYENQQEIAVMVVTGKVEVRNTEKPSNVQLVANERAVFHRKTTELTKLEAPEVEAPNILKRKEGMFVYKNEQLQKLIDDLQEYFGVNIQINEAIKACMVNANFYLTDDLHEILEPVAIMVNGELIPKNKDFIISGKGCP